MWDDRSLELWRGMKLTENWKTLEDEIDRRIKTDMESLTMCSPSDLISIQERVKALNELKRMPDDVVRREKGQDPE